MDKNTNYLGRGIHNKKFLNSLQNGNLKELLNIVIKDHDLDVQIRKDYLNIYYRGGNIARIKSEESIEFDKFYFYLEMKTTSKKAIEKNPKIVNSLKAKRDLLVKKFKEKKYHEYFVGAKEIMDKWLYINPKAEREEQHKLTTDNKHKVSDYTIIDLEYQVSTLSDFACTYIPAGKEKPKEPRFDIIAINKQGKVSVIELKKGTASLQKTSGLKEHWDCYRESIDKNHKAFIREMKKLLDQKKELNLIPKEVEIKSDVPEFMFAYAYDDKEPKEVQNEKFEEEYQKIGKPIYHIKLDKGTSKLMDA